MSTGLNRLSGVPDVWAIATYLRPDGWWAYVQDFQQNNIYETDREDGSGFPSPGEAIMDLVRQASEGES